MIKIIIITICIFIPGSAYCKDWSTLIDLFIPLEKRSEYKVEIKGVKKASSNSYSLNIWQSISRNNNIFLTYGINVIEGDYLVDFENSSTYSGYGFGIGAAYYIGRFYLNTELLVSQYKMDFSDTNLEAIGGSGGEFRFGIGWAVVDEIFSIFFGQLIQNHSFSTLDDSVLTSDQFININNTIDEDFNDPSFWIGFSISIPFGKQAG